MDKKLVTFTIEPNLYGVLVCHFEADKGRVRFSDETKNGVHTASIEVDNLQFDAVSTVDEDGSPVVIIKVTRIDEIEVPDVFKLDGAE